MRTKKNMNQSVPDDLLRNWRSEIDRLYSENKLKYQEIKDNQNRMDKLNQMIQLATSLEPKAKIHFVKASKEKKGVKHPKAVKIKHGTWTSTVMEIIDAEHNGITHHDLKEQIKKTHLAEKLKKTEKSFYGAIDKLHDRKKIIKHKGHLFSLPAFAKFQKNVDAGVIKDVEIPAGRGQSSPASDIIIAFLKNNANGANSAEIKTELARHKELLNSLKHTSFMYNVLANLKYKKMITQKEGVYYVAP